jgi:hypothetical protein
MTPGLYHMTFDEYLAVPALSRSDIVKLLVSPLKYKEAEDKDTEAMEFGRAYHTYMLEIDRFEKEYIVKPKFKGKGSKARREEWEEENKDKNTITIEGKDALKAMCDRLYKHPIAGPMLSDEGESELVVVWNDPITGALCKARIDRLNKKIPAEVDLKSCLDAREGPFKKSAWDKGYPIQAAFYRYGLYQVTGIEHPFYFIAQEKKPPYDLIVYKAGPDMLYHGQLACARGLAIYSECLRTDKWPGYPEETKELGVPGWVKN